VRFSALSTRNRPTCYYSSSTLIGNNEFIRLTAALICCRVFGIKHLILAEGALFLKHSFTTEFGVFVDVGGERGNSSDFLYYWRQVGLENCPSQCWLETARSIRFHILQDLPKPNISSSTLVMHMRGSDIFAVPPHKPPRWYGQPMCQHYTDVMDVDRAKGHNGVIIIALDRRNICVPDWDSQSVKRRELYMFLGVWPWILRLLSMRNAWFCRDRRLYGRSCIYPRWKRYGITLDQWTWRM
jgi:hypothetical protein